MWSEGMYPHPLAFIHVLSPRGPFPPRSKLMSMGSTRHAANQAVDDPEGFSGAQ